MTSYFMYNFSLHIRVLPALAYVPKSYVVVTEFEELLNSRFYIDNDDLLKPIIDYFEDNWSGRLIVDRIKFLLKLWNFYDLAKKGLLRTNNNIEGWYTEGSVHYYVWQIKYNFFYIPNFILCIVGSHHSTFWKIINSLKNEQNTYELRYEQLLVGHSKYKKKTI